jgi:PAS domain S-box-containing protein
MALAVPYLADWATLDLIQPDGTAERVAVDVADPGRAEVADRLWAFSIEPGAGRAGDRAIAERRPVIATLSPERLVADEARPGLVETIRALNTTSAMAVPLMARGTVEGVLFLAACDDSRRYEEQDAAYAMELARRIALAVGNARLYAAEQAARRAAEDAATQNARLFRDAGRFQTILDTVRDGVTMNDPRTLRVIYANDAVLEQLGRTRDEVVGHATPDWTEGLSTDELRAFVAPLVSGEESSRSLDVIRLRPDGTRVPVEIRWQVVKLPEVGPQLVAVSRNIRERIETEERLTQLARAEHARAAELNAIIGAIGEGLIVLDAAGRVTLANPKAQALLQPLEDWTMEAVLARMEDPDGRARAALTESGASVTLRLRAPARQWVEVSNYAVDDEPQPDGEHIVILRDVTVAREREAVRDAFVGILSHELRTPVTTIYAGAKVLSRNEGRLEEEARKSIFDDIHSEAERLHRLVEDVVALTRFGEGSLDIGSEPVLLQRIVPTVVRSEQARWPEGSFEVDMEAGLPPVSGDPTYVEQVIRNLLANAVKYGGSQPTIRLIARAESDEVQVRVLDEGPGFPEDESARLFELYYRSPATARSISGSGIGLFVCARLLHAMGGRIWAANRPEGGAEFGFALRVMAEERD